MAHKKAGPILLFQVPALSQTKVDLLIERIRNGQYAERELANLYDNAMERDLPRVMDEIKLKMRADFPRAATRKFGAKEKPEKVPKAAKATKAGKAEKAEITEKTENV